MQNSSLKVFKYKTFKATSLDQKVYKIIRNINFTS